MASIPTTGSARVAESGSFRAEGPIDPVAGPEAATSESRLVGLSRLLRGVGATALLAAVSSFLFQHWESGGDVQRYYALLAHTGLLGMLGFVWGLRADDAKGARTFLALAAGLVPAHFCILGGLVYSTLSWDGGLLPVASYATWIAPDAISALTAVGLTLATLGAVTAVAYVALVRARAALLGVVYLAGNALLLVPTRDASWVAALAGLQLLVLAAVEWRVVRAEPRLRTLEGAFVRAMLFAPPVVMLVRSALHYELSSLYGAVTSGTLGLFAFALAGEPRVSGTLRAGLRGASLAAIFCSCAFATVAVANAVALPASAALPLFGLGFGTIATGLSLFAGSAAWGDAYRRVAAWTVLAAMALDLAFFPGVVASLACLVVSIAALSYGFLAERRGILLAGAAGAGLSVVTHVRAAIDLYAFSHWGSLALLGVAVILAATLVERHGGAIAERSRVLRRRLAGDAWR